MPLYIRHTELIMTYSITISCGMTQGNTNSSTTFNDCNRPYLFQLFQTWKSSIKRELLGEMWSRYLEAGTSPITHPPVLKCW